MIPVTLKIGCVCSFAAQDTSDSIYASTRRVWWFTSRATNKTAEGIYEPFMKPTLFVHDCNETAQPCGGCDHSAKVWLSCIAEHLPEEAANDSPCRGLCSKICCNTYNVLEHNSSRTTADSEEHSVLAFRISITFSSSSTRALYFDHCNDGWQPCL